VLLAILCCKFTLTLSVVLNRVVATAVHALYKCSGYYYYCSLQDSGDMTDSEDTESIDSSMNVKRHNRRRDSLIFTS
jgi:hypothetical protein